MVIDDSFYLSLAIKEAWKYQLLTYPNPAVGSLILDNNRILAIEAHKRAGKEHAELNAIREAYIKITNDKTILKLNPLEQFNYLLKRAKNLFKDATIYITLEPCNHYGKTPPCATLIKELNFKRVVIGSLDINPKATGGYKLLKDKTTLLNSQETYNLLTPFKLWSNERFIFFKLAQRLNGTIDNGTISCENSRKFVHQLRDKIDLLIIGGETVRKDRPTLDSRLINGKSPDILILSNRDDFDKRIPLFNVKGRKVFISNSLDIIKDYNFIMIEGGYRLFQSLSNIEYF